MSKKTDAYNAIAKAAKEAEDVRRGRKEEARNNFMRQANAYANALGMSTEEFLKKAANYGTRREEAAISAVASGVDPAQAERDQRAADKAQREAQRATERAQREADKAQREAQREADKAQREAQKAAERAQREADKAQREAQKAAEQAQRQAMKRVEDSNYEELGRRMAAATEAAKSSAKGNPYGNHKLFGSKDYEPSKAEGKGSRYGRDWDYRPDWDKRGTEADARGRNDRDGSRAARREDVDRQQAAERTRKDAEEAAERARRDAEDEKRRNS